MSTQPDTSISLESNIRRAIIDENIRLLYTLKDICDKLHNGIESYKGFTLDQLPSDQLYEELVNTIKSNSATCKIATSKGVINNNPSPFKHENRLPDLWMGSIPKRQEIVNISSAIIMPKFDGCSCGVRFKRDIDGTFAPIKATTRGQESAHKKEATDILPKFLTISEHITHALNDKSISFKFSNGLSFNDISAIDIRGEIVAKDKEQIVNAAASYVAGKINGGMDVWNEAIDNLEFVPYEIINIIVADNIVLKVREKNTNISDIATTNMMSTQPLSDNDDINSRTSSDIVKLKENSKSIINSRYIPTQNDTIMLFDMLGIISYEIFCDINLNEKSDEENIEIIRSYYYFYVENLNEPIDGVVYCSSNWHYPRTKSQTTDANYEKFAWKPTSESTSKLENINYNISRDGKLGMETTYSPIRINGKTYTKCKMVPTQLNKLYGIGIGSVITVELRQDIAPYIKLYEDDENVQPYEFPDKCPFCGTKLIKTIKKETVTLKCSNKSCSEQMILKYKNFLTYLGIKGIAEGKLRKLKTLNINTINKTYMKNQDVLAEELLNISLRKFMFAIGYGTQKQIEKATEEFDDMSLACDAIDYLCQIADEMNDPFVTDVICYLGDCL